MPTTASGTQEYLRKHQEVIKMIDDNASHDLEIPLLVVVDGHVAKSHHLLEAVRETGIDHVRAFEKIERLAGLLRDAQTVYADKVHGGVDAALARALQVEDDGVLPRVIDQLARL